MLCKQCNLEEEECGGHSGEITEVERSANKSDINLKQYVERLKSHPRLSKSELYKILMEIHLLSTNKQKEKSLKIINKLKERYDKKFKKEYR